LRVSSCCFFLVSCSPLCNFFSSYPPHKFDLFETCPDLSQTVFSLWFWLVPGKSPDFRLFVYPICDGLGVPLVIVAVFLFVGFWFFCFTTTHLLFALRSGDVVVLAAVLFCDYVLLGFPLNPFVLLLFPSR